MYISIRHVPGASLGRPVMRSIPWYTMIYDLIIYHTILRYTSLCYTIQYCIILHYTVLHYTVPCYTMLYYTILYYTGDRYGCFGQVVTFWPSLGGSHLSNTTCLTEVFFQRGEAWIGCLMGAYLRVIQSLDCLEHTVLDCKSSALLFFVMWCRTMYLSYWYSHPWH